MADTTLRFRINSIFSGEGFTASNAALQATARGVKSAMGPLNQISAAFGTMNGEAGKLARGVTGVVSAFASMGAVGGILAAVQVGIQIVSDKICASYTKMAEAAKEAANVMHAKLNGVVNGVLGDLNVELKKVGERADADEKSLVNVENAAKKVNAAMGQRDDATRAANVVNLELEKLNEVIKAENENAAKLTAAEYDLKIAVEKRRNTMESWNDKVIELQRQHEAATKKEKRARQRLTEAKDAVAKSEEANRLLIDSGAEDEKALQQAAADLAAKRKILENRENELVTAEADAKTIEVNLQEAKTKYTINTKEATIVVKEQENTLRELKEQQAREKEQNERRASLEAEIAKKEEERERAKALREEEESQSAGRRKVLVEQLAEAEKSAEEWERKRAETVENYIMPMRKFDMDRILKDYEQNPKRLSDHQKLLAQQYQEWLQAQGPNPFRDVIANIEADIKAIDEETKSNIKSIDENIQDTGKEINNLKSALTDCLKLT